MGADNSNLGLNLGGGQNTDWLGYGNPYNAAFNVITGALNAGSQQQQDARSREAYGLIADDANKFGGEWQDIYKDYNTEAKSWNIGGKNFEYGINTMYDMFSSSNNQTTKEYAAQGVTSPLMANKIKASTEEKIRETMPKYFQSTTQQRLALKGQGEKALGTAQDWYSQGTQAEAQAAMTEGKQYWEYFAENL